MSGETQTQCDPASVDYHAKIKVRQRLEDIFFFLPFFPHQNKRTKLIVFLEMFILSCDIILLVPYDCNLCLNSSFKCVMPSSSFLMRTNIRAIRWQDPIGFQARSRGGTWSWTLKLAQKRSWTGRWSWAAKVGLLSLRVVPQQQCSGHCPCDSAQHGSWNGNCAVH